MTSIPIGRSSSALKQDAATRSQAIYQGRDVAMQSYHDALCHYKLSLIRDKSDIQEYGTRKSSTLFATVTDKCDRNQTETAKLG